MNIVKMELKLGKMKNRKEILPVSPYFVRLYRLFA